MHFAGSDRLLLRVALAILLLCSEASADASPSFQWSGVLHNLKFSALEQQMPQQLGAAYAKDIAVALGLDPSDITDLEGQAGRVTLGSPTDASTTRAQHRDHHPTIATTAMLTTEATMEASTEVTTEVPTEASTAATTTAPAGSVATTSAPAGLPAMAPLRGIAYGALPCTEQACRKTGVVSEDMLQEAYSKEWGEDGRDDLGTIARLGANAVRLYHSMGLDVEAPHGGFLDRAQALSLNVMPGYHTELVHSGCPRFDCYDAWKNATLQGFKLGYRQGDHWHPAISALILLNEPDFFGSDPMCQPSGAWCRVKAMLSALDGVLAAEREAGVEAGRVKLTVTWSFGTMPSIDGKESGAGLFGFQDTVAGIANPSLAQYTPRVPQAELEHAFKTRWVHGVNTQAPWSFVKSVMASKYDSKFAPMQWFIGEYGANGQPEATIRNDLEDMQRTAEEPGSNFLGAAFFQFQTAHFKGGAEKNFGLFRLGSEKIGEIKPPCYGGHCPKDWPVYCLTEDLYWLPGSLAHRANAVASAWHGAVTKGKGFCRDSKGGRATTTPMLPIPEGDCVDNTDFWGFDVGGRTRQTSVSACQAKCLAVDRCRFFTFVKTTGDCYLKTSDADRRPNKAAISGSAKCKVDTDFKAPASTTVATTTEGPSTEASTTTVGTTTTATREGGLPTMAPLRGIAYGALPCTEQACKKTGWVSEDMLQEAYSKEWGADGRDDLGTIARLGANAVRLYHSLGLEVDSDHGGFLDRAQKLNLNVMPGYHTEMVHHGCPKFDCYDAWRNATLQGFKLGFRQGDEWHPAVSALIILNEPGFFGGNPMCNPGGAWCRVKAMLSALDGVLAAEREAGVKPGSVKLTVTWSFGMMPSIDGEEAGPGLFGFQDTVAGIANPALAKYTPRSSQADLEHAFQTRWVHGVNTQAPWSFVKSVIANKYDSKFAPLHWFIGEYGANGQTFATIKSDLEDMQRTAAIPGSSFLGAAFFQFQTAHFKGGAETNFGLFKLGSEKVGEINPPCYGGQCPKAWPVYCLSPHLSWLPGTLADRAQAVAAAWDGTLEGNRGFCKDATRRLSPEALGTVNDTTISCKIRGAPGWSTNDVSERLQEQGFKEKLVGSTRTVLGQSSDIIFGDLKLVTSAVIVTKEDRDSSGASGTSSSNQWFLMAVVGLLVVVAAIAMCGFVLRNKRKAQQAESNTAAASAESNTAAASAV